MRNQSWPGKLARLVASAGITPNQISILSIVFGMLAGAALYYHELQTVPRRILLLVAAAAAIQMRLICNLIDGMVAVEGGKKTKSGEVFNDMPDRFSDLSILVPAGYGIAPDFPISGPLLGWLAAAFAILTAYARVLGGSLGLKQEFTGPMAKQHRMAVMTAACLLGAAEFYQRGTTYCLWFALIVIAAGSIWTTFRRTYRIIQNLEAR